MKLLSAYSLDLREIITADQADRGYGEGKIKSKFSFECPDENCHAQVTCANLDRPKRLRKRDPYYRFVEEHDDQCLIGKETGSIKRRSGGYDDIYSSSDEYFSHAVRLNLQSPSVKRPDTISQNNEKVSTEKRGKPSGNEVDGKRKIQRSKTLSAMIDAFLANESLSVQLPDVGLLDIKDLFVEVNTQELSSFPDEYRIYYGKAWINEVEKGYQIRFANSLKIEGLETRPSFFIANTLVENSSLGKFKATTLGKLANKLPKQVFILSETGPHLKEPYINFRLEGLEYMDYRIS